MTEPLLNFPCSFPLKVIGEYRADFCTLVLQVLNDHGVKLDDCLIEQKDSAQGRYTALTITFEAQSRAQLDAIYTVLSKSSFVHLVL